MTKHAGGADRTDLLTCAESIVETLRVPMIILDPHLRALTANRAFYMTCGGAPSDTEGRLLYELRDRQFDIPDLRSLLDDLVRSDKAVEGVELAHEFPALGYRVMLLNARKLRRARVGLELIVLGMEDITTVKRAEEVLREADARTRTFLAALANDLRNPLAAIRAGHHLIQLRRGDPATSERGLQIMDRQIARFVRLIDELPDTLPVDRGKNVLSPAGGVPATSNQADRSNTDVPGGLRVLVVDDNRDIAEGLRLLLWAMKVAVRVAHDGAEAVAVCRDWLPTHVLMDLNMPGMDGFEAARRLCADHPERSFRLVAVSGWSKEEHGDRARAAGFDHYLVKPLAIADLNAVLCS